MTAINIYVPPLGGFGVLLTDSLTTCGDGIGRYAAKAITFPHARCVAAFRGEFLTNYQAAVLLQNAPSFDEMMAWLAAGSLTSEKAMEIHVVGWSNQARRVRAFYAKSDNRFTPVSPPLGAPTLIVGPPIDQREFDKFDLGFDNAEADLLRLIRAQREVERKTIGGCVIATRITRDEIRQRIIHQFEG